MDDGAEVKNSASQNDDKSFMSPQSSKLSDSELHKSSENYGSSKGKEDS